MVHRHHLHQGLAEGARRHGVNIVLDARVTSVSSASSSVTVITYKDSTYTFDLLIGSDGLKSIVRTSLFPNVKPRAPTTNAAYRAVIPYSEVFAKHPELKLLFGRNSIDVWVGPRGYAISYPMSAGKDLNFVFSHHTPEKVEEIQESTTEELREFYKEWDPELVKVINMVESNKRWPLMVTGPLESWSNEKKNVVLMGDAAHSMVNHMAQGAATSMEDGAFLGTVMKEVVRGVITMEEAVGLYEKKRMPRAWAKQQASFLSGVVSFLDEDKSWMRNKSSEGELDGSPHERSWNLWGSPNTVPQ